MQGPGVLVKVATTIDLFKQRRTSRRNTIESTLITSSTGSGFGTSNSTPFGAAKPAFGASTTSSGSLFGSTTATSGTTAFGGFGSTPANTSSSSGFGGGAAGGGLFGTTPKPTFGTGGSTGGGLFGTGSTGSAFGSGTSQPTSMFSGPQSTALGGNTADAPGTGSTPFQAFTEKDAPGNSLTNQFQSISFMQPYQKYSFEELRWADYKGGRQYGNSSGQAGAFGHGSGFGGFGQTPQNQGTGFGGTGGGMFGAQPASTSSGFGSTTQTTGGFGTTSGGLFGQKPAGGLFGANPTPPPAAGLFGSTGQTGTTGFGTSTGGLFGTNQQQQPKPFAFGTANTTSSAGTGFGGFGAGTTTSGAGGGLFGVNASQPTSLFGGQQQQQTPASNPFGQPAQTQTSFGGFGNQNNNNQQKPGLFGATPNAGGSLFGGGSQNNQTGLTGGFGTTNQAGSLFGAKPESAGTGGLFSGTNNSNPTGGLFSNNNNANNQNQQGLGGSLFGNPNQQQPKSNVFGTTNPGFGNPNGGLFNNANNNASSFNGLGTGNQNQQGAGLFSNSANSNGSSLFGGPQQNNLQPPEAMTASIFDRNPYGNSSIFAGLPPPPQASPGPIATPISAGQPKPKKYTPLPQYKLNSPMSSRFQTPQKRGFGFTYSTYGTPSSASSVASTPGGLGLNNSLLGSSIGRSLGKSFSTSNLRRNFDNDADTILSPGAFSAGSSRNSGAGGLKRLTIDRSLRTDLFGSQTLAALPSTDKNDQSKQSSILKKKVSFDTTTIGGNGIENGANGNGSEESSSMTDNISSTPTPQEQGYLRSSSRTNGRSNGLRSAAPPTQPVMEQVKGNELAIVHEDASPENSRSMVPVLPANQDQSDPVPGRYYTRPSRDELKKMPREKLRKVSGFEIGREGCGHVAFDRPVDLTTVDLDNIFDNIAVITIRSLTVYPIMDKKPPLGIGLNVPSTITLENSWPRGRDKKTPTYEKSGAKFNKHVERLRRVNGTEFVKYDKDTGEWVFRVPHFTTYALDYDDNETMESEIFQSSVLSEGPSTPTPKTRYTPRPPRSAQDSSPASEEPSQVSSGPDDTFDFKKKRLFPGAYDNSPAFEEDHEMEEVQQNGQPFLGEHSAPSPSENGAEEPSDYEEEETGEFADESLVIRDEEMEMAGSFPQQLEHGNVDINVFQSKSILNASKVGSGTPRKAMTMGDDWAEQLERTISPRKHDRQVLRESQARFFKENETEHEETPMAEPLSRQGNGFATSIDLMNSIFGKEELRKSGGNVKQARKAKGFEWPYPKKSKTSDDQPGMSEADCAFHDSFKPTWGSESTLLYGASKPAAAHQRPNASLLIFHGNKGTIVSEGRGIRSAKIAALAQDHFAKQRVSSEVFEGRGVPYAEAKRLPFRSKPSTSFATSHEELVWELASILFDDLDIDGNASIPDSHAMDFNHRIRKDRLSVFWAHICQDKALAAVASATTAEERAIAYLSMNKVAEACDALVDGKDYRLATIIAQIGGDPVIHEGMSSQLEQWRQMNALSEMTDPIRALYELAAGNTCTCMGVSGGRIVDRVEALLISQRFNLDWKRAFGLRLWYGIKTAEPIEAAVKKFAKDLKGLESKKPLPWFIEEGVSLPWRDEHANEREDVLWGILKLYAESQDGTNTTRLADVIMPPNAAGNPMDSRFSFELYQALSTRFPAHSDPTRADQLSWDFAVQLEAGEQWHWAIFVILHLSGPQQRQKALQDLLARHAPKIEESNAGQMRLLTEVFKIPEAWIWDAKAVYARAVQQNHVKEVDFLLRGKNWDEAHKTLCRIVAPQAIIEEDYDTLFGLLENFGRRDKVADWNLGGQVYQDYVHLMKGLTGRERQVVLKRLAGSLAALVQDRPGRLGFAEMVAVQEMSAVVGKTVLADKENTADGFRVLRLPLTGDKHLQHTMDLSLNYYQALMANGSKD
ncbi:hypothetical protein MMC30_006394 [Trapelia coarctata]|nr:hypothetical protein [Trapelia coarctata]